MDKSTANAIEAGAAYKRPPHHLPLPELWQEIQREAQEQLVRVVQFLISLLEIFRVCLWLQTNCVHGCGAMRSLAGSMLEGCYAAFAADSANRLHLQDPARLLAGVLDEAALPQISEPRIETIEVVTCRGTSRRWRASCTATCSYTQKLNQI